MIFIGEGGGKLRIKCKTQHRLNSTIKSTTVRSSASRLIQMSSTAPQLTKSSSTAPQLTKTSSTASLKESTVAANNKQNAYSTLKYFLNTGNVDLKSSSKKSTSVDLEFEKKNAYSSTAHILNTNTADLKSSSAKLITTDLQKKKDAYFTTTYVFKTRGTDLTISLEESRATDPENLCKYAAKWQLN